MSERSLRHLVWAALVVAVVARGALLAAKPFWRDEAWVASLAGQPLDKVVAGERPRPVPIGFVALVKVTRPLPLLPPEISYRLVPLAAGVAAVILLAALGRALGGTRAAVVAALWLAAGLPGLIYYSRELKPYSLDLLAAVAVPLLALRAFGRDVSRTGRALGSRGWAVLWLVLAVAPWVTFGAPFPIAATLAFGWAAWWWSADGPTRARWALATAVFGGSLAAAFVFALDAQSTAPRLRAIWHASLVAVGGRGLGAGAVASAFADYFTVSLRYLFFPIGWMPVAPFVAIGAVAWPRAGRAFLCWLLIGTAAATVAAAFADRYVLSGRLLLFAAPAIVLLAAGGLVRVARWPHPVLGVAIAAGLGLWWAGGSIRHRVLPYRPDVRKYFLYDMLHDVEPLIDHLATVAAPGDSVHASRLTEQQFRFYARGRFPAVNTCHYYECLDSTTALNRWLPTVERRGWMTLLTEEDGQEMRGVIEAAGFDRREVLATRGALLWEVVRRPP